ncbi:hypothetical protein CapIbe_012668 [Capra ibex]
MSSLQRKKFCSNNFERENPITRCTKIFAELIASCEWPVDAVGTSYSSFRESPAQKVRNTPNSCKMKLLSRSRHPQLISPDISHRTLTPRKARKVRIQHSQPLQLKTMIPGQEATVRSGHGTTD